MTRTEVINALIDKNGYKSYLEIGSGDGIHFGNVKCKDKLAVDPTPFDNTVIRKTSDQFFNGNDRRFDIIFIDGLHFSEQVEKDIINSLSFLNKNGMVVCHDMLPTTEAMQKVPRIQMEWTGDCWKAFVKLRMTRDDLQMSVIDTDYGIGLITKGKSEKLENTAPLNWANFVQNKDEWMNILDVESFKKIYGTSH